MAASEATDGPVLSLMSKRLRALRKKYNRILQLEDSIAQGKLINKEQEEFLRSKPSILTLIDEYEKLRQPLSVAVQEELNHALHSRQSPTTTTSPSSSAGDNGKTAVEPQKQKPEEEETTSGEQEKKNDRGEEEDDAVVEDLLKLLYFGSLFDVKPQSDFTSTMLTRTHERGCCITYDYVTDDATDLLGEKDLDLISMLGSLVISRPVHSGISHKNALRSCVQHAKLWLAKCELPIQAGASITYAGLRQKLERILASDYFTTTPEMKAPVEVAAAAEKYAPCHVPVHDSPVSSSVPEQNENAFTGYEHQDEETPNFEGQGTDVDPSSPIEDIPKDESETTDPSNGIPIQLEKHKPETEVELNHGDAELKEQQYIPKWTYQNQRGGSRGAGGGRRGYPNGRGGRGSRGGGGYQNGRNQYYEQTGNYYQRNYYNNTRGRGGRGGVGNVYNNHGSGAHGGHGPAVESGS